MTQGTKDLSAVRHSVWVPLAAPAAFDLFTERFDEWWPIESHHIGSAPATSAAIEPHAGGRWYERAEDGSECDWGRIKAWEPPHRVLFAWQLTPEWRFDPDPELATEVEVTFAAEGDGTRVTLEHRGFEVHGEPGREMRASVAGEDGEGGWGALLEQYATRAGAG